MAPAEVVGPCRRLASTERSGSLSDDYQRGGCGRTPESVVPVRYFVLDPDVLDRHQ